MSQPYSTRFLLSATPEAGAIFTVPSGYVAVLRDIDVLGLEGDTIFGLINGVECLGVICTGGSSEGYGVGSWRGRQVLNAGEQLELAGPSTSAVAASGYLLTSS